MSAIIGVRIDGQQQAMRALEIPFEVAEELKRREVSAAMQAGMLMIRDEARILSQNSSRQYSSGVFTGALSRAIDVRPIVEIDRGMQGKISVEGAALGYAPTVENGRRVGAKHPPGTFITAAGYMTEVKAHPRKTTRTFKSGKRKGQAKSAGVAKHLRRVPPRRIFRSVLDDWIRNTRKIGVKGDDPKAVRERASVAYLLGRAMKAHGVPGRYFMRNAVTIVGDEAAALTIRLLNEAIKRANMKLFAKQFLSSMKSMYGGMLGD